MGQAKRRKQQLGDLYGTPESTEKTAGLNLRWMQHDEIEPIRRLGNTSSKFVAATVDGAFVALIVDPVIDQCGRFNSHMMMLGPRGTQRQMESAKARVHKAVNRFVIENSDVAIVPE